MAANAAAGCIRLNYSGGYTELKYKSEKGLSAPEWTEPFPPIVNTYLDGSMDTQFKGRRRKCRIDFGVVSSETDQKGIDKWYYDNSRTLDYNTGTHWANGLSFVPLSAEGIESDRLNDLSIARRYVLELAEASIRSTWPTE